MRRVLLAVSLLLAVGTSLWGAPRGPIVIRSDADFTPENGVVSGSGTPEDPFIIAGWEIQVPAEARFGVYIGNTTKPFILRGVRVLGALNPEGAAFFLEGVQGGRIEDCLAESSHHGLVLFASQGVTVEETYFLVAGLGLQVIGTQREHYQHQIDQSNMVNGKTIHYYFGLSDTTLAGIEAGHITVAGSQNVRLIEPRVEEGDGVVIAFCEETVVQGADLFRNRGHGLMVLSSPRTLVRDCPRIANNARSGIAVWLSPRSRVEGCGVYGNQVGVYVNAADRAVVTGTSLAGNALGVLVTGAAQEVEIADSLFYQNKTSIELAVAFGTLVERCAITDTDIGVQVDPEALRPQVRDCSFVYAGYGLSIRGSEGVFERNFIAYANIGIIFEETYGDAFPVGNVVRHNLIFQSWDGFYLGRETTDTWIYENLVWNCDRAARDLGKNDWAPAGRGNWYSDYQGEDQDGDGIGDEPVQFGGGGVDPAPLMSRDFLPRLPGVLGTMEQRQLRVVGEDGTEFPLTVLVADQPHERLLGFQGIPTEWAQELAMLFAWPEAGNYGFWNRGVTVDLELLFFDDAGNYLGRLTMPRGSTDRFQPPYPYSYALEVPSSRWAQGGVATPLRLQLP